MNVNNLTKSNILHLIDEGVIAPQETQGNIGFKKTHFNVTSNVLKSFKDNDTFEHIVRSLNNDIFTAENWGSPDTVKLYKRSIERLEQFLNDKPTVFLTTQNHVQQSEKDANDEVLELNNNNGDESTSEKVLSLQDITKQVNAIVETAQFILNTLQKNQFAEKHEYLINFTKLTLEELEQDINRVKNKI
jgi:hypothetical protein